VRDKTLNGIVSDKAIRRIAENLAAFIAETDFVEYGTDLDSIFGNLLDSPEVKMLILELKKNNASLNVSSFIGGIWFIVILFINSQHK
jgi:hypothetical protein